MSSSQDSDVDLQCERIIKPKKLIARFNCSLFFIESTQESTTSDISCIGKNNTQLILTESSNQTESDTNEPEPIDVQLPPELGLLTLRKNHLEFDSDPQKQQKTTIEKPSDFKKQRQSIPQPIRVKFQLDEFQKEGNQTESPLLPSKKQIRQRNRKMTKSCRGALDLEKLNQKFKKTTPVFSNNLKRSEAIREYIKDGNKIRTSWVKNLMNGYTEIDYYDSGKLRGIFNQGELVSGEITFPNKFVYTGQFAGFTFHGPGKLKFPSGQIFEGNWIYGYLQGKGKIRYPKGQIYCGQISNFRRQGEGYLYFANGDKYVGQFTQGEITGFGQFYKNGVITHKGFWLNGKFYGNDYKKFQGAKHEFTQSERIKRQNNKSKLKILQQSLRKICEFHDNMNEQGSNYHLASEAKLLNLSILGSTNRFLEQDFPAKPKNVRENKDKDFSLSIKFI